MLRLCRIACTIFKSRTLRSSFIDFSRLKNCSESENHQIAWQLCQNIFFSLLWADVVSDSKSESFWRWNWCWNLYLNRRSWQQKKKKSILYFIALRTSKSTGECCVVIELAKESQTARKLKTRSNECFSAFDNQHWNIERERFSCCRQSAWMCCEGLNDSCSANTSFLSLRELKDISDWFMTLSLLAEQMFALLSLLLLCLKDFHLHWDSLTWQFNSSSVNVIRATV